MWFQQSTVVTSLQRSTQKCSGSMVSKLDHGGAPSRFANAVRLHVRDRLNLCICASTIELPAYCPANWWKQTGWPSFTIAFTQRAAALHSRSGITCNACCLNDVALLQVLRVHYFPEDLLGQANAHLRCGRPSRDVLLQTTRKASGVVESCRNASVGPGASYVTVQVKTLPFTGHEDR